MTSILLLVAGLTLLVLLVALSYLFQIVLQHKEVIQQQQMTLAGLADEVSTVSDFHNTVLGQVRHASESQHRLSDRCRALEAQLISNRSFDHAIRMVKGGAKLDDLVDRCGLSPGEAKLVASLHQAPIVEQ